MFFSKQNKIVKKYLFGWHAYIGVVFEVTFGVIFLRVKALFELRHRFFNCDLSREFGIPISSFSPSVREIHFQKKFFKANLVFIFPDNNRLCCIALTSTWPSYPRVSHHGFHSIWMVFSN